MDLNTVAVSDSVTVTDCSAIFMRGIARAVLSSAVCAELTIMLHPQDLWSSAQELQVIISGS